jgi:hypothetical protein
MTGLEIGVVIGGGWLATFMGTVVWKKIYRHNNITYFNCRPQIINFKKANQRTSIPNKK